MSVKYPELERQPDGSYNFMKNGLPYNCPNTGEWVEEWEVVNAYALNHPDQVTEKAEPAAPSLEELVTAKKSELARERYADEISGTEHSGMKLSTDRESQSLIAAAALQATLDPSYTVQWKTQTGFVPLTASQIVAAAKAVRKHVQSCFDAEAEALELLSMADSAEDVQGIKYSKA